MSRLPARTAADIVRILKKRGFGLDRQSGSHAIYIHPDGRRTTVPIHAGRDLKKGTLRRILKDTGLDIGDL